MLKLFKLYKYVAIYSLRGIILA